VAAADLAALEDVRAHLQLQTAETEQDDVIAALITRLLDRDQPLLRPRVRAGRRRRDAPVPAAPARHLDGLYA
jgi:hypothetical protein